MKTYLVNKTAKTVFAMSGLYRYTVKDRFNGTIGKFWLFYSNPHRKFVALLKLLFLNLRTILFLRAKSTLLKKILPRPIRLCVGVLAQIQLYLPVRYEFPFYEKVNDRILLKEIFRLRRDCFQIASFFYVFL